MLKDVVRQLADAVWGAPGTSLADKNQDNGSRDMSKGPTASGGALRRRAR